MGEKKKSNIEIWREQQKAAKELSEAEPEKQKERPMAERKLSDNEIAKLEQEERTKQWHKKHKEAMSVILKPGEIQCARCHLVFNEKDAKPPRIYGRDKDGKDVIIFQSPFGETGCPGCLFPLKTSRKYDPKVDKE